MNEHVVNFYIGLSTVLFSIGMAIYKLKYTDVAGKIIFINAVWYLVTLFPANCTLFDAELGKKYHHKIEVFAKFLPIIDFSFCMLFYNFSNPRFRNKNLGIYFLVGGLLYWIANSIVFINTKNPNVYFLPFISFCNIFLSLISIYLFLKDYEWPVLRRMPVFWFTVQLLFYWGITFFYWLSYDLLIKSKTAFHLSMLILIRITDIAFILTGLIYLLYSKKTVAIE